jgi:sugar phosphate isomerase/epimerase
MQLGIFARTFTRPTAGQTLQAVGDAGIAAVQFNLSVLGLPTVPDTVPPETITATREAAARTGVKLAAISGTFNTAHPDPAIRKAGVARFPVLCQTASALGIPVITLSSGSRDPQDMWRYHAPASAAPWSSTDWTSRTSAARCSPCRARWHASRAHDLPASWPGAVPLWPGLT